MAANRTRPTKLQDVVEVVVKKFDESVRKDIDRDIIIKTQEALRFLNLKAPIVQKRLTSYDAPEVRAAILLEYVAREEKNVRLDMGDIAKKLGIKNKKNLDVLHGIIGNYRRTDATQSATGVNSRAAAAASGSTSVRQTRNSAPPPTSTIPRLAIRLSSLVQDPNGFAIKAKQLFQDMIEYVETLPHKRKQDYKQEIQQYRSAYEASCFYHVVSKTQTKKLLRGSSQQRQQQSQHHSNREDDRNRGLELDDILDASPDFSHIVLKQVLEHLGEMMEGIEAAKENKANRAARVASESSKKVDKAKTTQKAKGEHAGAKRGAASRDKGRAGPSKRPRSTSESETRVDTVDGKEDNVLKEDDSHGDDDDDDGAIVEPLHEFRQRMLAEACESAKKALDSENISDSEALAYAAEEVLRRFQVTIVKR